jgi:hypothetical protein
MAVIPCWLTPRPLILRGLEPKTIVISYPLMITPREMKQLCNSVLYKRKAGVEAGRG